MKHKVRHKWELQQLVAYCVDTRCFHAEFCEVHAGVQRSEPAHRETLHIDKRDCTASAALKLSGLQRGWRWHKIQGKPTGKHESRGKQQPLSAVVKAKAAQCLEVPKALLSRPFACCGGKKSDDSDEEYDLNQERTKSQLHRRQVAAKDLQVQLQLVANFYLLTHVIACQSFHKLLPYSCSVKSHSANFVLLEGK